MTAIADVVERVQEDKKNTWDETKLCQDIKMENDQMKLVVDGRVCDLSVNAKHQMLNRFHLPKDFLDRTPIEIAAPVINHYLERNKQAKFFVRGRDSEIRAMLTDRFTPIDNIDLIERVADLYGKESDIRVANFHITDQNFGLKMVHEGLALNKVGDLRGGLSIGNSETGNGPITIDAFMERLVCTNGMVVRVNGESSHAHRCGQCGKGGRADVHGIRIKHTSIKEPEYFWDYVDHEMNRALEYSNKELERFAKTEDIQVGRPVGLIRYFAKQEGFKKDVREQIVRAWEEEKSNTLFGVINAFTAAARGFDGAERSKIEEYAGELVDVELPRESEYVDLED